MIIFTYGENSPASSVNGQSMQPDRDSFHTADGDITRRQPVQPQTGNGELTPSSNGRHYIPHSPEQPQYGQPNSAMSPMDFTPHLPPT